METQLHQSVLVPSVSNAFQITRMTEGVKAVEKSGRKTDSHLSKMDYMCECVYLYAVNRRVRVYIRDRVCILFQLGC